MNSINIYGLKREAAPLFSLNLEKQNLVQVPETQMPRLVVTGPHETEGRLWDMKMNVHTQLGDVRGENSLPGITHMIGGLAVAPRGSGRRAMRRRVLRGCKTHPDGCHPGPGAGPAVLRGGPETRR